MLQYEYAGAGNLFSGFSKYIQERLKAGYSDP